MKLFVKFGVLLIGMLWVMAHDAYAFSIGEFHIKSKFGEKIDASFEINLDFDGPVEVGLGNSDDYARLGLERQDIIDALILNPVQPTTGALKRTVHIHSNNPLFFPSFNLVVWATHNGGKLLENFLVTVDFQQSLALNVGGKKKKSSGELPKYKPEPAESQEKIPLPDEADQFIKNEPVAKKLQETSSGTSQASDSKVEEPEGLPIESISPVPVKQGVGHRRRLSGVIWASPRSSPEPSPKPEPKSEPSPELVAEAIAKTGDAQDLSASRKVYVLQKGEGLFSVARNLKVGSYHPAQVAVAIWMHNIDKFIFGNIHGIQEVVQLDLENLDEHLSSINLRAAKNILKNQAVEWKLTKSATPVQEEASNIPEIPLPSERLEDLPDLFEQVSGWQDTWEKMDKEGHLAYYQVLEPKNPSLIGKELLLSRHPKPQLETSSKFLVLKEGAPMVFFSQAFSSENLKSLGLKELEWTRSSLGWKIHEENFYEWSSHSEEKSLKNDTELMNRFHAGKSLSFIIHVSSHSKKIAAVNLTNKLRGNGYDAYWAPVRMSRDTLIYRVYVGRFSDWNQAHRVVRILRKKSFGGHATAIPYPLALKVGESNTLKEARAILEALRNSGLSGLLLASYNEPEGIHFRVVVGAFKKAGNVDWMLQQLKRSGFTGELISP